MQASLGAHRAKTLNRIAHCPRRRRGDRRFTASAADEKAAEAAHAGEDSWSVTLCLWLLNPAVVFQQLSSKVRGLRGVARRCRARARRPSACQAAAATPRKAV